MRDSCDAVTLSERYFTRPGYIYPAGRKPLRRMHGLVRRWRRFRFEFTEWFDRAMPALRFARLADITAMQDQPVMRIVLEGLRRKFFQSGFDGTDILAGCEPSPVCHTENMRIDCNYGLAERCIQDHVGGFTAYARQAFERFALVWNLAAISLEQDTAGRNHVFRLDAKKTNGFDVLDNTGFAEREDLLRCIGYGKHAPRGFVHRNIGGLGRQHHGDEQFEWASVFELGCGMWVEALQGFEEGEAFVRIHAVALVFRGSGRRRGSVIRGVG